MLQENPRLKKYRSLKELGADMQEWHSSSGDPIYAVGSFYYSDMDYPDRSVIERARDRLESLIPEADAHMHGWKTPDANRLRAMVRALNEILAGHGPSAHSLKENPRRPPKLWMRHCVRGVEESNRLYNREADPGSVCGSLWYHKMSPAQKRAALHKEGKKMEANPMQENPVSGAVIAVGTLLALGVGYFLLRDTSTPAAAAGAGTKPSVAPSPAATTTMTTTPTTATTPPVTAPTCAVDNVKLNTWALSQGKAAFYLPTLDVPVTLPNLTQQFPVISMALAGPLPILIVTADGQFWTYDSSGNPVAAPALQASYCQSTGQTPGGGTPIMKITTLKGSPSPFAWLA